MGGGGGGSQKRFFLYCFVVVIRVCFLCLFFLFCFFLCVFFFAFFWCCCCGYLFVFRFESFLARDVSCLPPPPPPTPPPTARPFLSLCVKPHFQLTFYGVSMLVCASAHVCVWGGWRGGWSVCACAYVYAPKIVSRDTILHFINTLIIIIIIPFFKYFFTFSSLGLLTLSFCSFCLFLCLFLLSLIFFFFLLMAHSPDLFLKFSSMFP